MACRQAAAMEPDEHGTIGLAARRVLVHGDVQIQAVLSHGGKRLVIKIAAVRFDVGAGEMLHRHDAALTAIAHALPRTNGHGRLPAKLSDGGFGVGNGAEFKKSLGGKAENLSAGG